MLQLTPFCWVVGHVISRPTRSISRRSPAPLIATDDAKRSALTMSALRRGWRSKRRAWRIARVAAPWSSVSVMSSPAHRLSPELTSTSTGCVSAFGR